MFLGLFSKIKGKKFLVRKWKFPVVGDTPGYREEERLEWLPDRAETTHWGSGVGEAGQLSPGEQLAETGDRILGEAGEATQAPGPS